MDEITIIELILEEDLLEDLTIIAELTGVPIEAVIVMACRKYIEVVNRDGFPKVTGVGFRLSQEEMDAVEAEDEAE